MVIITKRLVYLAFLLLITSQPVHANTDGIIQAKLAYMDLLAGNVKQAYQRIPVPSQMSAAESATSDSSNLHPTLAFARQMRLYGQNKLSIEALEYYTESGASQEQANNYWLEFGEYFLDSGSIASAKYCLDLIKEPIAKPIRPQYYRLKAEVLLHQQKTDDVEYILKKKWKGRHPEKPYTRFNLASAYLDQGNFDAADTTIEKLKKDFPKKADEEEVKTLLDSANLRIGFAHLTSGNLDLAKSYLVKIPLDSMYAPRATLGLAWVELGKGQFQTALSPLAHLIETDPDYSQEKQEAYSLLPVVASQQQKYGKAASLYDQAKQFYLDERDAIKRRSIPVYSGKAINQLTAYLSQSTLNEFNISQTQQILSKPIYAYLFKLLEKDSTKTLFNSYFQQTLLLQDLTDWRQEGLLKADSYQRLSQLMGKRIYQHKDKLIRVLASEIETHISRLESMASQAQLSAGKMYDIIGSQEY